MSLLHPSTRLITTSRLRLQILPNISAARLQRQQQLQRSLATTAPRKAGDSSHAHEDHYDQPGGYLWGVKPGEKYEKEGWEDVFFYGFCGSLLFLVVGYAFKPDTSIQTWALEEARRRLEKEGILEDPETKQR